MTTRFSCQTNKPSDNLQTQLDVILAIEYIALLFNKLTVDWPLETRPSRGIPSQASRGIRHLGREHPA